jgi:hypothetical protein
MTLFQQTMDAITVNNEVHVEGSCADCGRWTDKRGRFIDPHTRSEVELCANCIPAFLHRQQSPAGCCG